MEFLPGLTLEQHYEQGVYPVLHGRSEKFPEGESLDDLTTRADKAAEEIMMPHIQAAIKSGERGVHVAIVSHGLCISQLIPALLRRGARGDPGRHYKGLLNTAWSRVTVELKNPDDDDAHTPSDGAGLAFQMRVTDFNRHEHLDNMVCHSDFQS